MSHARARIGIMHANSLMSAWCLDVEHMRQYLNWLFAIPQPQSTESQASGKGKQQNATGNWEIQWMNSERQFSLEAAKTNRINIFISNEIVFDEVKQMCKLKYMYKHKTSATKYFISNNNK